MPIIEEFTCVSCDGAGVVRVAQDEYESYYDVCPVCGGSGMVEDDPESIDEFVPERDALTLND